MQMYRVKFVRRISSEKVDLGDVVVCAASAEMASDAVVRWLDLPRSETEMDVSRVKPSLYQVSRREVSNTIASFDASIVSSERASSATFPGVTESHTERQWHYVSGQAFIRAENENEAIASFGRSVLREMAGEKQKGSCKELDISADRREWHPRTPSVEQNALYTFRRIFQGGDART